MVDQVEYQNRIERENRDTPVDPTPPRNIDSVAATTEANVPQMVRLISHSTLFYWWPVWAFGYLFAAITALNGVRAQVGESKSILLNSSPGLGIIFVTILLLVITFTNIKLRGIYSVVLVLSIAFISVLFAWLGWWDAIFELIPELSVHMNVGFYLVLSTALLAIWLLVFFVFDRMTFYIIRPGQMTVERIIGGAETSYDTRGMLLEERGDDLFRHMILGLGSGDLQITTTGARREEFMLHNVLFADWKVKQIQRLISLKPVN